MISMERGLDVSGHQAPGSTLLAGLLANPLYRFVICKATEGQGFHDLSYPAHRANNTRHDKRHAAYHFAWPNQDPLREASNFVLYAALLPGEVACLDLENWDAAHPATMSGTPWSVRITYALVWLREVRRLTGATPAVYMNWDWIKNVRTASTTAQWAELCTYPTWLADYDSNAPGAYPSVNPKVAGGPTLTVWLHQWTASRPLNDGGLDGDALIDPTAWARYAVPAAPPPDKELFTVAQYDDIMAALAVLTNKVEQKANIVDVKAVSSAVNALAGSTATAVQVAAVSTALTEVSDGVAGVFDEVAAVESHVGAVEAGLTTIGAVAAASVNTAVKDSLTGFAVHTTMTFPTG